MNKDNTIFYMSTESQNDIFLQVFKDDFDEVILNEYTIYKINFNTNKIKLKVVGMIDVEKLKEVEDNEDEKEFKSSVSYKPKIKEA